ncbi:hypothetical protein Ciccas_001658 [Cichlidogyrus casuarinus]|uniref:Protein kinase domain-containing protein n=1 Tax=Cichlidogyrus casuarinus TaxID=1844966 RepID=A0ABD2QJP7_9PLAT
MDRLLKRGRFCSTYLGYMGLNNFRKVIVRSLQKTDLELEISVQKLHSMLQKWMLFDQENLARILTSVDTGEHLLYICEYAELGRLDHILQQEYNKPEPSSWIHAPFILQRLIKGLVHGVEFLSSRGLSFMPIMTSNVLMDGAFNAKVWLNVKGSSSEFFLNNQLQTNWLQLDAKVENLQQEETYKKRQTGNLELEADNQMMRDFNDILQRWRSLTRPNCDHHARMQNLATIAISLLFVSEVTTRRDSIAELMGHQNVSKVVLQFLTAVRPELIPLADTIGNLIKKNFAEDFVTLADKLNSNLSEETESRSSLMEESPQLKEMLSLLTTTDSRNDRMNQPSQLLCKAPMSTQQMQTLRKGPDQKRIQTQV